MQLLTCANYCALVVQLARCSIYAILLVPLLLPISHSHVWSVVLVRLSFVLSTVLCYCPVCLWCWCCVSPAAAAAGGVVCVTG